LIPPSVNYRLAEQYDVRPPKTFLLGRQSF